MIMAGALGLLRSRMSRVLQLVQPEAKDAELEAERRLRAQVEQSDRNHRKRMSEYPQEMTREVKRGRWGDFGELGCLKIG